MASETTAASTELSSAASSSASIDPLSEPAASSSSPPTRDAGFSSGRSDGGGRTSSTPRGPPCWWWWSTGGGGDDLGDGSPSRSAVGSRGFSRNGSSPFDGERRCQISMVAASFSRRSSRRSVSAERRSSAGDGTDRWWGLSGAARSSRSRRQCDLSWSVRILRRSDEFCAVSRSSSRSCCAWRRCVAGEAIVPAAGVGVRRDAVVVPTGLLLP
mmetsp:Transcript_25348/g.101058  ORF Transcript_25348/g.101058 Transcript_25348/m.101058 type:complete len:214 (-) Transcript_25348:33-674(-)